MIDKPRPKKLYIKIPENWKNLTEKEKEDWIHLFYNHIIQQLKEENK